MARRIVIVGGGYAGALCAVRTARKVTEEEADVVLVSDRPHFVERIRLHEDAAGPVRRRRSYAELLRGTRVKMRIARVAGADLGGRRLAFEGDEGPSEAFDDLVLATGSVVARPRIPGIERALSCANEDDALALRTKLEESPRARIVIVGGGLTGLELASELAERRRGLAITLVTNEEVGPMVVDAGRAHVRRVLAKLGVTVREKTRGIAFEEGEVLLGDGSAIACDVAVWAGGFEASPLARAVGLEVDEIGRAYVDERLRSRSHDFVRVIGDAARVATAAPPGAPDVLRMACATAVPQGAFAADAMTRAIRGEAEGAFSFGYAGRCVSLGRKNGVIQLADPWDVPTSRFLTDRTAAFVKEMVCRYPLASIRLERWGLGYRWPCDPQGTRSRRSRRPKAPRQLGTTTTATGELTSGAHGPM